MAHYSHLYRLTPREREVLRLLATGKLMREIATEMGIEVSSVRAYASDIYAKIGVRNKTELALWAVKQANR
jgi:DNA-binding NarL/FixJ family response regulator